MDLAQENGWRDGEYIPSVAGTYTWKVSLEEAKKFLEEKGIKYLTTSTATAKVEE